MHLSPSEWYIYIYIFYETYPFYLIERFPFWIFIGLSLPLLHISLFHVSGVNGWWCCQLLSNIFLTVYVNSWLLFCKLVYFFLPCMLVLLTVQNDCYIYIHTYIYIYIYIWRERERERVFLYFLRIRYMNLHLYIIDTKLKRHF